MRARCFPFLVAAVHAAALPLAAQQEPLVVRQLSFQGNRALDDFTLGSAIATTGANYFISLGNARLIRRGERRYLDELEFRRDVVRLLLLYRQNGYMNAVIDTVVRRTARDASVTFRIYEGEPVRVTRFDLRGLDAVLDTAALRGDLPLHVGDPFNRFLFQASADTIVSRLRNRGYPYAEVLRNFDVDAGELRAEATLEVIPGPRVRIGAVVIEGTEQVDSATVRRVLSVKPSDLFRQDELYQTQRDLYGMGLFRSATVVLVDSLPRGFSPGDTTVRVLVRVQEGPRRRLQLGAGFGSIECFRVQSGWSAHGFLGGARTLDITARVSRLGVGYPADAGFRESICRALREDLTADTIDYSLGATLRQLAFLSARHTASVGLFAERRSEIQVFTRQAVGFNVGVALHARRQVPVALGYSYSLGRTTADPAAYCSVFRACAAADQAFLARKRRFAAVTVWGVRDLRNSVLDPTAGSLVSVTLLHTSRVVGSDPFFEFNRGEVEISQFHALGRRTVFAWRVRAGSLLPQRITLSGQSARFVPPDQRFYAGGPHSVRGYGRNELGPRVYVSDSLEVAGGGADTTFFNVRAAPIGGNTVFVLNAEVRLPTPVFPDRMRVGVFVDVGQVRERAKELVSVRGVRVTPGVGLRFATPLGPVRLDAAYNGYAAEPGPLYFQNNATKDLTLVRDPFRSSRPASFWRRVVLQFAVGQVF